MGYNTLKRPVYRVQYYLNLMNKWGIQPGILENLRDFSTNPRYRLYSPGNLGGTRTWILGSRKKPREKGGFYSSELDIVVKKEGFITQRQILSQKRRVL